MPISDTRLLEGRKATVHGCFAPQHPTLICRMIQSRVKRMKASGPVPAASLVRIAKTCGKPGRRCARGDKRVGHYLTFKLKAKTHTVYVPQDMVKEVSSWIAEHRRLQLLDQERSQLCLALARSHVKTKRRRAGRS